MNKRPKTKEELITKKIARKRDYLLEKISIDDIQDIVEDCLLELNACD